MGPRPGQGYLWNVSTEARRGGRETDYVSQGDGRSTPMNSSFSQFTSRYSMLRSQSTRLNRCVRFLEGLWTVRDALVVLRRVTGVCGRVECPWCNRFCEGRRSVVDRGPCGRGRCGSHLRNGISTSTFPTCSTSTSPRRVDSPMSVGRSEVVLSAVLRG